MTQAQRFRLTRNGLQKAANAGHLFLVYQPKLDLRSGKVTGVEALARWNHPRLGEISPADFIPAVERSGLIDWFSEWALSSALAQWSSWKSAGLDLDMAVNISALNLSHVSFPDLVAALCTAEGLPVERLMLEVTEGATQEAVRLMDTISRFRLKGVGMSLDDFGTGFGSLIQLRGLPFTELKVDRAFVADLLISRDSRAITRGLIHIAHEIGLIVTAEGVEDQETLDLLVALGCDKAQGFFIAVPMPGDRLELWMRKSGSWRTTAVPPRRTTRETSHPKRVRRAAKRG
jgi:EAL domain-containing protein (putative c-di-GMP-specific phosphodiesterase class I)